MDIKEEVKKSVDKLKPRYNIELVSVTDNGIVIIKLTASYDMNMEFKIAGKTKTMEDVIKEEVEEKIRTQVKSVKKVIFVK